MEYVQLTPSNLQDALCREIEDVLIVMNFKTPQGSEGKLKAFPQALPIRDESLESAAEDEEYVGDGEFNMEDPFPYAVVRIDSGDITDPIVVRTVIIIGIYDDDKKNQGHKTVLNIIQKINERFSKNPTLASAFRMKHDSFKFTLQEDDSYPYFFGGIDISWESAAYRREDPFT